MPRPTIIDGSEVFDSGGTLALTVNGYDMLYLSVVQPDPTDPEAADRPKLTDEQHQKIIDVIVEALGVQDES